MMLVATAPGCTTVRPTDVARSSSQSDSESPRTANLVAQYADCPAMRDDAEQARDVDDVGAIDLREMRHEEVAAVDHAPQVHADDRAPSLEAGLRKRRFVADAGVVDEHVHGAVRRRHLAGELLHADLVADIRDVGGRGLADTGSAEGEAKAGEAGDIAVDKREMAALVPEPEGHCAADPARGPGDDRDLPG